MRMTTLQITATMSILGSDAIISRDSDCWSEKDVSKSFKV
jgi:hypothetical protein